MEYTSYTQLIDQAFSDSVSIARHRDLALQIG